MSNGSCLPRIFSLVSERNTHASNKLQERATFICSPRLCVFWIDLACCVTAGLAKANFRWGNVLTAGVSCPERFGHWLQAVGRFFFFSDERWGLLGTCFGLT